MNSCRWFKGGAVLGLFLLLASQSFGVIYTLKLHSIITSSYERSNQDWGMGTDPSDYVYRTEDLGSVLVLSVFLDVDPLVFTDYNYGWFHSATYDRYEIIRGFTSRFGTNTFPSFELEEEHYVEDGIFHYFASDDDSYSMSGESIGITLNLATGVGSFSLNQQVYNEDDPLWLHRLSADVYAYEVPELEAPVEEPSRPHSVDDSLYSFASLSCIFIFFVHLNRRAKVRLSDRKGGNAARVNA